MKKTVLLLVITLSFLSCKNDASTQVNTTEASSKSYDQNDGLITMRGDFIYDEAQNAAVLSTPNDIYGVVIDDKMKALNAEVIRFKKEKTDMVPVTVRVRRFESGEENTWKYRVEIKEILKVEAPAENKGDVIKLSN